MRKFAETSGSGLIPFYLAVSEANRGNATASAKKARSVTTI